MPKEDQIMTLIRVLIVLTFLTCFFVNVHAQPLQCATQASLSEDPVNQFSNELEGLKFYGKGKLSALTFAASSREDVRSIFGAPLRTTASIETYDYDSDWQITFVYFDSKSPGISSVSRENGVMVAKRFFPKPEYVGKIYYIILVPKNKLPINQFGYPDKSLRRFREPGSYSYTYSDLYGLKYTIQDREAGLTGGGLEEEDPALWEGRLLRIEYGYPCSLNKSIYAEEK